ncbi:hypothetical protein V6Z11_D11G234400 [Gossypium hirsutum]
MFGVSPALKRRVRGFGPQSQRGHARSFIVTNDGGSHPQGTSTSTGMPLYKCLTTHEEMVSHLPARGILFPNFTFHFEIITGERHVSDSSKGLILLLYLLKDGFHLPLHPFFCMVLKEYGIAPGQLIGLSWWTCLAYFLHCNNLNGPPLFGVFQRFYRLKVLT